MKESTMRKHTVFAATTVLSGLVLAGCANSSATTDSIPSFCTLYRTTNDQLDAAYAQITQHASPQTVHSALDTIVAQLRTALDASPPESVKSDLQTMYTAMVQAQGQLAAVNYEVAQLPGGPPAVDNPQFSEAARNITRWGNTNCGTPLQGASSPSSPDPTR
jgi:outer membrane murein-binding lipoprotein Lpp